MSQEDAVQYEFYFPAGILEHQAVTYFIGQLEQIFSGATIFAGLIGIWRGESETTHIYRMLIRKRQFGGSERPYIDREIERMMDALAGTDFEQDAFLFTAQDVGMSLTGHQSAAE